MPGTNWNRCTWLLGPRLVVNNKRCKNYNENLIKLISGISFVDCDKACSSHPECVVFFYGRPNGSYFKRCYLQRFDSTAPAGTPCTYYSTSNYDTFLPTTGATQPSTTPGKCTHIEVFSKTPSKITQCKAITSLSQCPIQKCGWKEVRSIPAQKPWHPSKDKLVGTDVYGVPYSSDSAWSIKYDNIKFDQFMFTTGDFTKWLVCHKDAVLGWYSNSDRPVLKSSSNSKPYKAKWYRRTTNPEDPWVSIGDYNTDIVYGGNAYPSAVLAQARGGAKVFIRDSSGNHDEVCYGPSTVEAKTGCQWTPVKATLLKDSCECRDSAFILDRLGSMTLF